ncbi:hypothetical protein FYK55_28230 [Roseiconus nitratireducens]|uniref:Uncharacterized protein n=1 Tax=Roseiconus nitratireducens TaxID=2605748 RepID=A0A5M6CSR9_9BACT|nr:hypothetical protein [Roseiconus nitratireducens]KAA5536085.1 hypothetical protein FYK55_28230 [Roseiconus nitratireducens]
MKNRNAALIALAALVLLLGWSAYVVVDAARHRIANSNVSHQMRGDAQSASYPVVLSHSILNSAGEPRIVLLHRLTKPMRPANGPPFKWINRLAINPDGSKLEELRVCGDLVWVHPSGIQFYFTTDDQPLHFSCGDEDSVSSLASPEDLWTTATSLQSHRVGEQ